MCLRKRIALAQYSIKQLEESFCGEGQKNKKSLAEVMAALYLELFFELHTEYPELIGKDKKENPNPYHIRMFEAVALGAMCVNEFGNH
jgi:hypothetical protein